MRLVGAEILLRCPWHGNPAFFAFAFAFAFTLQTVDSAQPTKTETE